MDQNLRSVLDILSQPVIVSYRDGLVRHMNEKARKLFGFDSSELIGVGVEELVPNAMDSLVGNGDAVEWVSPRNGLKHEVVGTKLTGSMGDSVVFLVGAEESDEGSEIKNAAYYDPVTSVPNRQLFNDRLKTAIFQSKRTARMVALFAIDIDGFRLINETSGHASGDDLLVQFARRISENVRDSDTVARLGSDEFAVIQNDVRDVREITVLARRLIDLCSGVYDVSGAGEVHVGINMGISIFPMDAEEPERAIKYAEMALSKSKKEGRNNYQFYSSEMDGLVHARLSIEKALRAALINNEFELYYQPQVSLETGKIVGAEALVRWNSPERGFVSPGDFIPIAEETGLIVDLGDWVLREACKQAVCWHTSGLSQIKMSVNLSGEQFKQDDMQETIRKTLEETGMNPANLGLEITESVLVGSVGKAIGMLRALDEMGIEIALDDFGTGYSSLSYLKRFKLHTLKIDRSFVSDIGKDPDDEAIADAIIGLGKSLGMKVIAEGVETTKQLEFVRSRGCQQMQGYYFSRPVPANEFEGLLASSRNLYSE